MMGGSMPSLADIAAVTRGNNNDDGFGGNNGWWILILLWAIWGRNGYGNENGNGGNGGGSMPYAYGMVDASLQRGFDNQAVISKLDGINGGVCSLGYDQLAQMNGINTNIMQTGFTLQQALNNLSTQFANCCCDQRVGQLQIQNQMSQDNCATIQAINQAAQSIMQNCNANYRQLHDEQVALQMEQYKTQIANMSQQLNNCDRDRSNAEQSAYLLSQLKAPAAVPAYQVPNPNYPWPPFGFGFGPFGFPFQQQNDCNHCNSYGC